MSVQSVLDSISNMTVLEIVDLIKAIEDKFGVTAAAPVAMAAAPAASAAVAAEEKTEFNVRLMKSGDNKVNVIKVIRTLTSLGLKEAKDLVDGAPAMVKEAISKDEAEDIKKKLVEAGAEVEIS